MPDRHCAADARTAGPASAPRRREPSTAGVRTGVHWRPGPASAWTVAVAPPDRPRRPEGESEHEPGRDDRSARRHYLA